MTNMTTNSFTAISKLPAHQHGAVTLMMSLIVLVAVTLLSIYSAKTAVIEQRISANEYRAMEVSQAASAGLDYGLIWIGTKGNAVSWTAGTDPSCFGTFDEHGSMSAPNINAANSDAFTLSIVFCRNTAVDKAVIQVASTATASSNASLTKTVRVYTRAKLGPVSPGFIQAPLTLSGCLSNVGGKDIIWPATDGGIAIETKITPKTLNCVDPGDNILKNGNGFFTNPGIIDGSIPDPQDMWDYVFTLTRAEIQTLAAEEVIAGIPDTQRNFVWITDPSPFHTSYGSPTHFTVVVFDAVANCPKINGGPVIYGVVFVDSDCPAANGFGGTVFYGSVIVNGLINKLNANTEFHADSEVAALVGPTFPDGFAPSELGT